MGKKYTFSSLIKLHFISKEVSWKMDDSVLYLSPHQRTRYYRGENKSNIFFFGLTNLTNMTKTFPLFHNTARVPNFP